MFGMSFYITSGAKKSDIIAFYINVMPSSQHKQAGGDVTHGNVTSKSRNTVNTGIGRPPSCPVSEFQDWTSKIGICN